MSKVFIKIKDNNFVSAHVVIIKDGNVLLLKRSSTDEWMPNHYGLPGGKLDNGETLSEAATRECKEEINLHVSPKDLIFLPKISNNKEHAFFYTTKFAGEPKISFEHSDFQWVNPKNLSKYQTTPDLLEIIIAAFDDLG